MRLPLNRPAVLPLTLLAILLAVCALLYWPAMHGPFLFDDFPNLDALTSIDHVSSWRELGIYLSQPRSFPGRPLAMLSFLLQKAAWPDHSFPFKLVNLLIHLFNGVLVYRLTGLLCRQHQVGTPGLAQESATNRATLAALFVAAAWLLNPIQLSGVLLVVQRMTLLMGTFVLLGLLAYLKGLLDDGAPPLRRGAWMVLGLGVCMGLSFLSKENGILLPLYALVLDATVLRSQVSRLPPRLLWWRRILIWPTVLFVLGYLIYAGISQATASYSIRDFTLVERLLTEPRILFDYLGKTFLPRFGLYGLYHDGYPISHGLLSPWTTALAMIGVLAAAVLGWFSRKRWPLLALALLWYLGGQMLESSTVMLELYFEHRNYVPILGPFIALGIALAGIREPARLKLVCVVALAWLASCAFALALSAKVYGSEDRLAAMWSYQQPHSARAQSMLAGQLLAHGQPDKALAVVEATLQQQPDNAGLAENRIYLKCTMGTLTTDDIQVLTRQLHRMPFNRLGFQATKTLRQLADSGRCPPLNPTSWHAMIAAMLNNPHFASSVAQGYLHYQLHEQAVATGDLGTAIKELDAANKHDPNPELPRLQAQYLVSAGLYDQAIDVLKHADYSHLRPLRRLLVNDRAMDIKNIEDIKVLKSKAQSKQAQEQNTEPTHTQ